MIDMSSHFGAGLGNNPDPSMAPHKLKGTDPNLIQPTPEEIAEARSILKNNSDPVKKEKSAMACFSAWAKANNIPEDVSKSRGEKRREYMEKWLVFQSREKTARSTNTTTKTVGEANTSSNSKGWKSYEWLKQRLGERKLQTWIY